MKGRKGKVRQWGLGCQRSRLEAERKRTEICKLRFVSYPTVLEHFWAKLSA
jgi:hypothetical protein